MAEAPHRSGLVALLGRPNAGKSTLLNHLVGEKLAIVTAKPQTTRSRILGVLTLPGAQLLLLDTPGFHEGGKRMNRALNALVDEAVEGCDVALLLVDPRTRWDAAHAALVERCAQRGVPLLVARTKSDLGLAPAPLPCAAVWDVSAQTGEGVPALLAALVAALPEAPAGYDADTLTDRPLRFLAAELVREAIFETLAQELPYETAVEIESFDESDPARVRIRANLLVERESQKGMVVGRGGATLGEIGRRARLAIQELLGRPVHLDLWVKREPGWSKRPNRLKSLGYQ